MFASKRSIYKVPHSYNEYYVRVRASMLKLDYRIVIGTRWPIFALLNIPDFSVWPGLNVGMHRPGLYGQKLRFLPISTIKC